MAKNRYTRALKVLKNSQVDEKLQILEALPTNNTTGLYVVEPAIINTVTIEGLERAADFTQDGDGGGGYDGTDTTGLFLTDGTILTIEPPGDTSYILGPMSAMWYAWGNFTQIGYIRQSDRKMVNLARITGQLGSWDGSSNFTSYGQLTLDQAVWFQGTPKLDGADNDTPNYRSFYPGPPSNVADEFGRYLCVITGTPKATSSEEEQRTPDVMGDAESQGYPWEKKKLEDEDKNDELMQLVLNAAMLGLDIAAVVALLFPEPGSSVAGAAHLATKLRYVAKLRRFRGALNPFGQRAVRSGAAGRVRRQVYSGRPYQGTRGFGKTTYGTTNKATARTYSNPGPLKGTPGTGSRVNPRGTVDTGTLPQRYIDKYGSRSVLGQKQVKLGPKAAKRTFGEENKFILEQINNYLLETAATGSGLGGGTEVADGYVDKVSETSSPEQLEKASDDANNIATAGGKGLSDADLLKIDKDAEEEAKRVTNINISNPESLSDDQLFDSLDLMYESDPEITIQLLDQYEYLIDTVKLDKEYEKYTERKEYISSQEFARNFSPEYARQYDIAQNLWNNYFSRGFDHKYAVFTRDNIPYWWNGRTPEEGQTFHVSSLIWDDTGREFSSSEYQKVRQWSASSSSRDDLYMSKVYPEKKRQRELAESEYRIVTYAIFRPSLLAMIRGWNEMFGADINDDPFALDEPVPYDLMGDLLLLGISAAAATVLIKTLGAAKIATLTKTSNGVRKVKNWWNKGRDGTVPGENTASWKDLKADDLAQGAKFVKKGSKHKNPKDLTNADFEGGAIPRNLQQLGDFLTGRGGFTWSVNPFKGGGLGTGPTALTRQLIERPFRTIIKFFESSNLKGNLLTEETSDQKALYDALDAALKETDPKDFGKVIDKFLAMMDDQISQKKSMESYEPKFLQQRSRQPIQEVVTSKQKRILREIKKPFEIKEAPTKFKVKPTGRNNKVVGAELMKPIESQKAFKPDPAIWKAGHKKYNEISSQDKKNHVLELVGAAEHHWSTLIERSDRERQEKVNEAMAQEFDREMEKLYEKYQKKETKVDKVIQSIKTASLDKSNIKSVHPDEPPPERVNGYHPKYGQKYKHDKLDPHSAEFMPDTGNPTIDANIRKSTDQEKKNRKVRILRSNQENSKKSKTK